MESDGAIVPAREWEGALDCVDPCLAGSFAAMNSLAPLPPKRRVAMLRRFVGRLLGTASPRLSGSSPAANAANLPELTGRTEIVRDARGVPHVFAENEADLFAVLGFLHGADRFVLLDLLRHLGAGRFCELLGNLRAPSGLDLIGGKGVSDVDGFLRPLDFEAQSEADYGRLDARHRACLDRFADGVNAALRAMRGVYPDEYLFFGRVRPWHPYDALLNGRTCAFVVSLAALEHELTLDAVRGHVGDRLAQLIYPDVPWSDAPTSYTPVDGPTPEPGIHDVGGGSNNWAVAGTRSASGAPIVANDPHVPVIPLPTFWYHVHVDCGAYRVQGGQFPGCPTFGLGHNGHLAWGVTTGFRDGWDLYRVHRLVEDPTRYRTVEGSGTIHRHVVSHYARFGSAARHEWESCEHGILYPGWRHHDGVDLAVRFVPSDTARYFEGSLALHASRTVEGHQAALAMLPAGPFVFNNVYGHRDGHIGWELYGRLPKRRKDGLFVRDAHDPDAQWDGFVPFADMPKILGPERALVCSANAVTDLDNFDVIATASHFEPRLRQEQVEALLAERNDHDVASFRAIQADVRGAYAPALREAFCRLARRQEGAAGRNGAAYAALRDWDGVFDVDSAGAAVYVLAETELAKLCFTAVLGPQVGARFAATRKARPRIQQMLVDAEDALRVEIENKARESLEDLAARALAKAAEKVEAVCGRWRWGAIQRVRLGTVLSVIPGIGRRFVALDEPLPGDMYTINPSINVPVGKKLISLVGPSTRFICDLGRPDEAWFSHSSGPSGDPGSPFFGNLSRPWIEGEYFRSRLCTANEVEDVVERWTVEPGGS